MRTSSALLVAAGTSAAIGTYLLIDLWFAKRAEKQCEDSPEGDKFFGCFDKSLSAGLAEDLGVPAALLLGGVAIVMGTFGGLARQDGR